MALLDIIVNVTSLLLFLSPVPTFYKVFKWKSTKEYSGVPYVLTLANCLFWILYGIPQVNPDSFLDITINATGVVLECFYLTIFILYSPKNEKLKVAKALGLVLILFAVVTVVTLTVLHTYDKRSLFVGLSAAVFCTAMYAAPLYVMEVVSSTKSVKYMPLYSSLAGLVNGMVWTSYGVTHFDIFVTISNGLGIFLAIVELILYGKYYRTTKWDEEEDYEVIGGGVFYRNIFRDTVPVPYNYYLSENNFNG